MEVELENTSDLLVVKLLLEGVALPVVGALGILGSTDKLFGKCRLII